jgi:hypothetical protein
MEFTGNVPLMHHITAPSNCDDEEEDVPSFTGDATCTMELTAVMPSTTSAFPPPSANPIFPEATQHFTEMTGFSLPAADDTTANLDMKLALSLKDRQSLYADDTGTHDLTGLLVAATGGDSVNSSTYTDASAHISHSQSAVDAPTPTGTDGFTSRLRRAGSLTHNDSRCVRTLQSSLQKLLFCSQVLLTLSPCSYASDASMTPSSACGASGFTAKLARVANDLSADTSMELTGTVPQQSEAVNRLLGRASVTPGRTPRASAAAGIVPAPAGAIGRGFNNLLAAFDSVGAATSTSDAAAPSPYAPKAVQLPQKNTQGRSNLFASLLATAAADASPDEDAAPSPVPLVTSSRAPAAAPTMASPVRARENIVASSMNISTPSVKLPSFNPAEYNTASASGRRSSLGAADSGTACDMSTNVSLYNDEEDVPGGEVKRRSMGFGSRTPSVQEFMDAMGVNFAAAAGAPRLQRKSVVASSMPPAMTGTASEDKLRGAYVHEVKRTSVEHAIVKVKESAREFKNAAARKEVILNRQGFHALDVFVGSSDEQVLADVHSTMRLCKKAARLEADHMWIPWRTKQERTTQQALAIMIERMDKDMAAVSVAKADIKSQRDELRRGRASKASALAQGAPLRFDFSPSCISSIYSSAAARKPVASCPRSRTLIRPVPRLKTKFHRSKSV